MAYPSFVENGDSNIARIRRPHLIPSPTFWYSSKFRGGLGIRIDITMWADHARVSGLGMCQELAAPGLLGGDGGGVSRFILHPDWTRERRLPSVFSELAVEAGTTVRIEKPSGAGFGDPLGRDPERVQADVLAGKVSREAAKRDYGVVLTDGRVDRDGTAALRKRLKKRT